MLGHETAVPTGSSKPQTNLLNRDHQNLLQTEYLVEEDIFMNFNNRFEIN